MSGSPRFSFSRLADLWHVGFTAWRQQIAYDIATAVLSVILTILGGPIAFLLIEYGLSSMVPVLYIFAFFVVGLPILGMLFCEQISYLWRPQDLHVTSRSHSGISEEDNAWGPPGRLQRWFKAWSRGAMSLLVTSVPRFVITVPIIVLSIMCLIRAFGLEAYQSAAIGLISLFFWLIASPILTAVLCTWLMRKMFAVWELETFFQTHYLQQDVINGVRRRVHGKKGHFSIKINRKHQSSKLGGKLDNKLTAEQ